MAKEVLQLTVAPRAEVRRDICRNVPWLAFILVLGLLYVLFMSAVIRIWESDWSFLRAAYFTVINMTTVGFGDVSPVTGTGKVIAGVNGVVGLILFGGFVAVIALALQPASWSASLVQAQEYHKHPQHQVERVTPNSAEEHAREGMAEMLEGLAKVIRGSGEARDFRGENGRVLFRAYGEPGDGSAVAEVWIHILNG